MRLVEVEWSDPRSVGGGSWIQVDEIDSHELTAAGCKTVGYVLRDTPTEYVLVASLSFYQDALHEVGDGLVIPKVNVQQVRDLKADLPPIICT